MVLFRVWFICLFLWGVMFANWFVGWGLCLVLGLSVSWLGVMFGIEFVCLLVGGYVIP